MSTETQETQETQEPKKHAGGRPRKDANDNIPLQQAYELAVKKALTSSSASERTQALAQAGAMLTPTLGELRAEISELKKKLATAEEALPVVTRERDTAQGVLCIAIQAALQGTSVKAELAALKTDFDAKLLDARKELVEESTKNLWSAQRSANQAKDTLKEAQAQFGSKGLQTLLDYVKSIIEQNHIAEPDPASLPAGISSLMLTCWGHSAVKAQLMLTYHKSFPEPSENFKQALLRVLRTGQLQLEGMRKPDPIPDLDVKREVLTAMAVKWNVLNEVQRIADNEDVQCRADFLRTHYADLAAAQHASSLRGEGRTPIVSEQPVSVTGYTGPHDPLCACGRPGCNPLPEHLRMDTWLGTRPTEKVEDINARHADPEVLSYGNQLIEREALAKKGKVFTVLPPESMAQSRTSLDDNEGE